MRRQKFADNPFLIGHDNQMFKPDEQLGFVHKGGDFIGEKNFVSLKQTIKEIRRNPQLPIVLNMGDSSTSGWEADAVSKKNMKKITERDPFFHYLTYSDIIRTQQLHVINAGISGFSSLQGKIYLKKLLRIFAKAGVDINYITLYFGNNDGVYSNVEDKVSIEYMKSSLKKELCRVSIEDYRENINSMIETARTYGAKPVIIVPVVNLFWKPGLRSQAHEDEYRKGLEELKGNSLHAELLQAQRMYSIGKRHKAYMLDRFLPRIKPKYLRVLQQCAKKQKVSCINVQKKIPSEQNKEYFRDYCHPLEPINELIATGFDEIASRKVEKIDEEIRTEARLDKSNIYPLW